MTLPAIKKGILLAAFGSSSIEGETALTVFADQVRQRYPGIPVRWAFTSGRMRNRLAAEGKKTDSVKKALCRLGFERYTHVAVQSLHLIHGVEYEALIEETEQAAQEGGPKNIAVGQPLLQDATDVRLATQALFAHLPEGRKPEDLVVWMGHGTWHTGDASYQALAAAVAERDPRILIGTLEGSRCIKQLLPEMLNTGASTVWLLPLLSIIGRHAIKDMAGTSKKSWRAQIEAAGFNCHPILKGTVEYPGFSRIWLEHLGIALQHLGKDSAKEVESDKARSSMKPA